MLGSHMNMFIWQGIILLFFVIFPLMVKFLLQRSVRMVHAGTEG